MRLSRRNRSDSISDTDLGKPLSAKEIKALRRAHTVQEKRDQKEES